MLKRSQLFSTTLPLAFVASAYLMAAIPLHADQGGEPNIHTSSQAFAATAAHRDRREDQLILGITPVTPGVVSSLRITNAGTQTGTATVTIFAADTGAQIATWTSPDVPAKGSLLVDVADIASGASPALTSTQASQRVDLEVTGTLHGAVQTLVVDDGVLSNISTCSTRHNVIGGVPGPGSTTANALVRIGNPRSATSHATLTLYDSASGTQLGTWTSADVPPNGSITVSTTAIAAAATPVIPATTKTFTLAADPSGLKPIVLAQLTAGGAPTVLNNACRIKGSGAAADEGATGPDADSDHDDQHENDAD